MSGRLLLLFAVLTAMIASPPRARAVTASVRFFDVSTVNVGFSFADGSSSIATLTDTDGDQQIPLDFLADPVTRFHADSDCIIWDIKDSDCCGDSSSTIPLLQTADGDSLITFVGLTGPIPLTTVGQTISLVDGQSSSLGGLIVFRESAINSVADLLAADTDTLPRYTGDAVVTRLVTLRLSTIPEPSTAAFCMLNLVALLMCRRRAGGRLSRNRAVFRVVGTGSNSDVRTSRACCGSFCSTTNIARIALIVVAIAGVKIKAAAQDEPKQSGASATEPLDLVKKAIEAHGGGELIAKYPARSGTGKGTMVIGEARFTYEATVHIQLPDRRRTEARLVARDEVFMVVHVFNSKEGWEKVAGQEPTQLSDGWTAIYKIQNQVDTAATLVPLLDKKKYKVTSGGELKVNEKNALVVNVANKSGHLLNIYFDPETHLTVKLEYASKNPLGQGVITEAYLKSYKKIDGILSPMQVDYYHDGKLFGTVAFDTFHLREELDNDLFRKPE